ncbi:putative secondary metabolism biosynthetic enzyme [Pyricularia oryzae]|uniref:Secondary metabolism biosynthetic enzyme n=1 Tax=Pyricularia grisea TaxID=148305 RepID=A0ABQ8NJZ0_PYRGI|nr:putative secondary metabolism biosynthetic enzyme [Pyricularia grisea]KAI6399808.1 putative secondary metabolism biosynthetic enzyme [Pyricularia oryzae]KAI6625475.1 putative secondary metabolism biosynthetic enzyme [Pyricularia oryzae]
MAADLSHISSRMRDTVEFITPLIDEALATKSHCIDLATAENWLLRSELREMYSASIAGHMEEKASILGDEDLRASLAEFFGAYFRPRVDVTSSHIVATPGATHCMDALLTSICDSGDSVLVPVPYWNGFGLHFRLRPRVNIIPVIPEWTAGRLDENPRPLGEGLLPALKQAMAGVADKAKVKALVMTNPNNPLGQCYPEGVLQEALDFCREAGLHYISDELYALSQLGTGGGFVSALSLDARGRGTNGDLGAADQARGVASDSDATTAASCNDKKQTPDAAQYSASTKRDKCDNKQQEALVHVIWSTSKDMCSSGVRIAALVSQSREAKPILTSVGLLSSMHVSSLSSLATTQLLRSPALPGLVAALSRRLARAHAIAHARFRRWGVPFLPADAGPFVLVRLGSWAAREDIMARLRLAHVTVAEGKSFGGGWCDGDGGFWVRLTVAVPPPMLWDGLNQIGFALGHS